MDAAAKVNKAVRCDTCGITLNSTQQADQHYTGKTHLRKLKGEVTPPRTPKAPRAPAGPMAPMQGFGQAPPPPPGPRLDPVSQGVLDNMMGNIPTGKRKEVPCDTCGIVFNSEAQANAHFEGSKHAKKQKVGGSPGAAPTAIDMKPSKPLKGIANCNYFCVLCNVSLNSPKQLEAHKTGQAHKNREQGLPPKPPRAPKDPSAPPPEPVEVKPITQTVIGTPEVQGNQSGWFHCSTCDISVPSALALQQHIKTPKHKESLAKTRNGDGGSYLEPQEGYAGGVQYS